MIVQTVAMNHFRETLTHLRTFPNAFWVVIAATFINQIGNMAFVFLVLYLSQYLKFSLSDATFAFAIFSASMLTTSLLGGSFIDKIGSVFILISSLFINGIVLLIIPFIHTYFMIIIMCMIWGFTFGFYRPASQTFVSYLSKPGISKITFSVYRLSLNLGMSIGPAIGGYLATHSFVGIFIANGIANIFASCILLIGLMKTSWFTYRPSLKNKIEFSTHWLKRDATLRLFLLGMIPVSMIFFQHESTLAVYLHQDLGLPLSFYGWLFTVNTLMIVFLELPLNIATFNWPYRTNFILGSIFITIGFAGLIFADKAWHIVLLTIFWTIGEMILFPSASSFITEIAKEENRGSYMSLFNTCSNLGLLLGPWSGAFIMQYFGGSMLWVACGLWGIIPIILFKYLSEPDMNLVKESVTELT